VSRKCEVTTTRPVARETRSATTWERFSPRLPRQREVTRPLGAVSGYVGSTGARVGSEPLNALAQELQLSRLLHNCSQRWECVRDPRTRVEFGIHVLLMFIHEVNLAHCITKHHAMKTWGVEV
jgi:hypothetical protein